MEVLLTHDRVEGGSGSRKKKLKNFINTTAPGNRNYELCVREDYPILNAAVCVRIDS